MKKKKAAKRAALDHLDNQRNSFENAVRKKQTLNFKLPQA